MEPTPSVTSKEYFDLLKGGDRTPVDKFQFIQDIWRKVDHMSTALRNQKEPRNQFLAFTDVPPEILERNGNSSSDLAKSTRWEYSKSTATLLMKIPAEPDNIVAPTYLAFLIMRQVENMGVEGLLFVGTAAICYRDFIKRADACFAPAFDLDARTLVLEVGLTESASQLNQNVTRWLLAQNSPVLLQLQCK